MFEDSLMDLRTWWRPFLALVGGLAVGIIIRRTILKWVGRMAAKSSWKYDDVLVEALNGPIVVWFGLIGLRLAVRLMNLDAKTEETLARIILIVVILSVTWAAARFAGGTIKASARAGHLPSISLFASMARLFVIIVGVLVALQSMDIRIGPVIGALGIGGLAIGLALQDTLANFFAGIRIIAARKIRSGDLIKLDTGQEGFVQDINWGLTTLRGGDNNLVIVPNAKLSTAIVVNYSLPASPQNVTVELGVSYGADLERVETIALEVAVETQRGVPEGVPEFVPALRYKEFGEYAVRFFVVLQAQSHQDRFAVVSDYIKRLHRRFKQEGLSIPLPHRVVVNKTEGPAPE